MVYLVSESCVSAVSLLSDRVAYELSIDVDFHICRGVNGNNLNGPLPDTLGNLDKLVWLDISQNQFSGDLPVSSTSASSIGLDNLASVQHL